MTKVGSGLLRAISSIACEFSDRPRINGVLFRGGEIVATDGHRIVRVPFEHDQDFFMPRDLAVAAVGALEAVGCAEFGPQCDGGAEGHQLRISLVDGNVVVDAGGFKLSAPALDIDSFPPMEKIFESLSSAGNAMGHYFNPDLLAGLWDVIRSAGDYHHGVRMVSCGGPTDAIVYQSEGGIVYALMPLLAPAKAKEAA